MTPFWNNSVARWVEDRVPHAGPFGDEGYRAMGVEHKGETVAGFVFHNWDPRYGTIEVSGASDNPRWATASVVRCALDYVFDTCGCQMLYARQFLHNERARQGWLHLGASEVIIPRMFGIGADGTIITLTNDQWWSSRIGRRDRDGRR